MIFALNTAIMLLTLISPFIAIYAISFIRKGDYQKHAKIQKMLFYACMIALVVLEAQIRLSGGSGSIVKESVYYGTPSFKVILVAHIIGAVLTYVLWAILIFFTSLKFRKKRSLDRKFAKAHRFLGYVVIIGLLYTATTALAVYLMTFIL